VTNSGRTFFYEKIWKIKESIILAAIYSVASNLDSVHASNVFQCLNSCGNVAS